MCLGGKKTVLSDDLFISTNIRIYHHMDAEFEVSFYNCFQVVPPSIIKLISKSVMMI